MSCRTWDSYGLAKLDGPPISRYHHHSSKYTSRSRIAFVCCMNLTCVYGQQGQRIVVLTTSLTFVCLYKLAQYTPFGHCRGMAVEIVHKLGSFINAHEVEGFSYSLDQGRSTRAVSQVKRPVFSSLSFNPWSPKTVLHWRLHRSARISVAYSITNFCSTHAAVR